MTRIYAALVALAVGLLSFSGVSWAASVADPDDGSLDAAKAVYDAFTGGHKAYAAALAVILAVALLRKSMGGTWAWLHTDAGSMITVLVGSTATALASALAGGGAITFAMTWSSLCIGFGAAGGYTAIKKFIVEPLAPKLPAWLSGPVLWLFQHASDVKVPTATVVAGNTGASANAQ